MFVSAVQAIVVDYDEEVSLRSRPAMSLWGLSGGSEELGGSVAEIPRREVTVGAIVSVSVTRATKPKEVCCA